MASLRQVKHHIAWLLVAKIGLIALLFLLFFSPSSRPDVDAGAVDRRIQTQPR